MDNKMSTIYDLEKKAMEIRFNLLRLCNRETIHIGGDLSITDVMTALWLYQMKYDPADIHHEGRDRFVLSKGHASAVTSFCQAALGCFSAEDVIREYATDQGRFSVHSCNLVNPYVEVSTGSLGHGMPIACGMAAGLKLKGNTTSRVYTVMGDGEQSEGSIWEAALNAVHYQLGNLVAIVDNNGLESDGTLQEITALGNIAEKYRAFQWHVMEIDGNNMEQIVKAFDDIPSPASGVPTCIIAHTVKGRGVAFMENQVRWHAGRITDEQLSEAMDGIRMAFERKWSV